MGENHRHGEACDLPRVGEGGLTPIASRGAHIEARGFDRVNYKTIMTHARKLSFTSQQTVRLEPVQCFVEAERHAGCPAVFVHDLAALRLFLFVLCEFFSAPLESL